MHWEPLMLGGRLCCRAHLLGSSALKFCVYLSNFLQLIIYATLCHLQSHCLRLLHIWNHPRFFSFSHWSVVRFLIFDLDISQRRAYWDFLGMILDILLDGLPTRTLRFRISYYWIETNCKNEISWILIGVLVQLKPTIVWCAAIVG